ncbi:MAG: transposase [Planctomycetes bacterium]|nr:transposase [Planctomycetota bacterium]
MPRASRLDEPNSLHHVMNRGLARRPVFESPRDVRFLLSRLARAVRAGTIELHAYAILTTHFHLLVRSLSGELSETIGRVEHAYVRWFNRGRGRDGPLFRGRFTSRRVDDDRYERAVQVYIAHNPVVAGLSQTPAGYRWSSAHQRSRPRPAPWIARGSWPGADRPRAAEEIERATWLVEARLHRRLENDATDPLPTLLGESRAPVLAWLRRRAALADGTEPGLAVAAPAALAQALRRSELRSDRERRARNGRPAVRGGTPAPKAGARIAQLAMRVALLRELCGLEWSAIASSCGCANSTARDAAELHRVRVRLDRGYAEEAAAVAHAAIAGSWIC